MTPSNHTDASGPSPWWTFASCASAGDNEVLKGVNLKIARKEVVCIIGKSGSGKSTLLRCLNGLEHFQEGSVTVDGQPIRPDNRQAMRELRQNVGMIFKGSTCSRT